MHDSNYPLQTLKKTSSNIYSSLVCILTLLIYSIPVLAQTTTEAVLHHNGLAEFDNSNYPDNRKYTEVCWLTAHNAFSSKAEGWVYAQQNLSLQDQFNHGVRSFMIDLWWYDPAWLLDPQVWWTAVKGGNPTASSLSSYVCLCHENGAISQLQRGMIFSNSAPVQASEFFRQVRDWLNTNDQAIITLHLESHLENGPLAPSDAINQLFAGAGLLNLVYRPAQDTNTNSIQQGSDIRDRWEWPTLREMRSTGKRLVIFSDKRTDDDPTGERQIRIPNRILNVGSYRETQYGEIKYSSCEMRGGGRDRQRIRPLFLLNHFYTVSVYFPYPDSFPYSDFLPPSDFSDVNRCQNIQRRLESCSNSQEVLPNFIAVDRVEEGDALAVVQAINRLPPNLFKAATDQDRRARRTVLSQICTSLAHSHDPSAPDTPTTTNTPTSSEEQIEVEIDAYPNQ